MKWPQAIGMVRVRAFKRKDFQQFMAPPGEGSLNAAEMLNQEYRAALSNACRMALSGSVAARMARLLLDMGAMGPKGSEGPPRLHLSSTHEEIATMIGTSRASSGRE